MTDVVTGSLQVDLKRRTTLPGNVLAAAGIHPGSSLVARVEEPGRIVLESPALLLSLLQDDIAAALTRPAREGDDGSADFSESQVDGQRGHAPGPTRDLVAELLAERAADSSLTTRLDDQQDQPPEAASESPDKDGAQHGHHSSDRAAAPDAPLAPSSDRRHPRDGAA